MWTPARLSARSAAARRALGLGVIVILAGAGLATCSSAGGDSRTPASSSSSSSSSATSSSPSASAGDPVEVSRALRAPDWQHALQVIANLRAQPPAVPLVLLLGSSIVRESMITDASWAAQVQAQGGPVVETYDLGSRNQSFAQDLKLVPYLPQVPTIVFIGVDVVRFVSPPSRPAPRLPAPSPIPASYNPHHYTGAHIYSAAKKRALAADWMANRYPVFKHNYAYNLKVLKKLIAACKARGLHPVLLDTPRNTPIVGHVFGKPVATYRATCKKLAVQFDIPFVDKVAAARFADADFFDLWHAVPPGRTKWQLILSNETVRLLTLFGMNP
jgi:hypothetical protein